MKEIPLTKGYVTQVDDEDFERLSQWRWRAKCDKTKVYAARTVRVGKVIKGILMHRIIMAAPAGSEVDHRDRNGLNNQRSNLRLATKWQNGANRGAPATNTSGFKGVSWNARARKWHAQITVRGVYEYLGSFTSPEAANAAYVEASKTTSRRIFTWRLERETSDARDTE